ncbi:MAG: RHS repeat-associated core domain-containing protein [Aureispira sp.]
MISYEEYYPYGASAYRVAASGVDLSLKRYRFTGKERDEETGLDYFGVRYYASWLGRWTSGDPGGFVDGLNLYRYTRNNPVNGIDAEGYSTEKVEKPKPPPVDPPKKKSTQNYAPYGFLSQEKEKPISPIVYGETYEVHSAVFSEKLVDDLLSGKLSTSEELQKEIQRIKGKGFKDVDAERYATQHYNAPGGIDKDGDSQVVSVLNSTSEDLTIYGYYNASDNGSLWRYKIIGGNEEKNAPTMFYTWEVDPNTMQPVEWDAEFYANLPSSYTDQTFEEGMALSSKTAFTVVSVLSLGASFYGAGAASAALTAAKASGTTLEVVSATGTLNSAKFFAGNAIIGMLYSAESSSGVTGEGIIERNLNKEGKVLFNGGKTLSSTLGGGRGLFMIATNPANAMTIFNSVTSLKSATGAYLSNETG